MHGKPRQFNLEMYKCFTSSFTQRGFAFPEHKTRKGCKQLPTIKSLCVDWAYITDQNKCQPEELDVSPTANNPVFSS